MAETQRSIGTVKWFSGQKGFGFIAPDDGGEDLFVHQTEIQSDGFRTLREGQKVEFAIDSGEDGRAKAVDVVGLAGSYRSGGGRGRGTVRGGGRERFGGRGTYGRYDDGYGAGGYGRGGRRGGRTSGGYGSAVECYNCGRMGHFARDCYRGGGGNWGYGSGRGRGRGGGGRGYSGGHGGRGGGGGLCYSCGEEGHFARDCPN